MPSRRRPGRGEAVRSPAADAARSKTGLRDWAEAYDKEYRGFMERKKKGA
jgi:hypothetical protein